MLYKEVPKGAVMMKEPEIPIGTSDLCFGCGQKNPHGLKLKFSWDGRNARTEFTPQEYHQGWKDLLHGGVLTAVMDEAMGYAAYYEHIPCVSGIIEVRLREPARIGEPLIVTASVTRRARRLAETEARLTRQDGTLVAEAKATQIIGSSFTDERERL
jgi:acyl-coenzyme A thioesterase PaaI-like protein